MFSPSVVNAVAGSYSSVLPLHNAEVAQQEAKKRGCRDGRVATSSTRRPRRVERGRTTTACAGSHYASK